MWAKGDGDKRRTGAKVTRWAAGVAAGNDEAKRNRPQTERPEGMRSTKCCTEYAGAFSTSQVSACNVG